MEKNIAIDYLRLSITDLCNLNCMYCTPLEKSRFLTHDDVLRYEEMARLVRIFTRAGINKVRLTGGEPLIKRGVVDLVKMLKGIEELKEISMTSNGILLKNLAPSLKAAGLDRINISLDTLRKDRFKKICGKDAFDDVWAGVEEAIKCGFDPVKLNVIPMQGVNDDELPDFARLTLEYPLIIRFIEFFHTNQRSEKLISSLISSVKTKKIIEQRFGVMNPIDSVQGNGPARYYKLSKAKGAIGFISGSTGNFCGNCNRIRVDCAGRISPCLFSGQVCDTRGLLRGDSSDDLIKEQIKRVFNNKSKYSRFSINERVVEMSSLGG
ncbi:MAG: GTP 3',8-cyclase MoaA [Candidatus Omnitrophica bacterium]|nr:GTP 3',8-cyclase MoaA [Candidatus Omnitrophota bacterium]